MNVSLPVIDSMFAGAVAAGPRRSKPRGMKDAGPLWGVPTGAPCLAGMANARKTDNSAFDPVGKPVDELLRDSQCMLRKKMAAGLAADQTVVTALSRTSSQGPGKAKRKLQRPAFAVVPGANPAQLASAKESLTAAAVSGIGVPTRSHVVCKQPRGAKNPSKPVQLTNNLSSNALKPALAGHSNRLIAVDMQQEAITSVDKVLAPNPKTATKGGDVSGKPGPNPMVNMVAADRISVLSGEKPPVVDTARMLQRVRALQERLVPVQRARPDAVQTASAGSDKSVLPGDRSVVGGPVAGVVTQKPQVLGDHFPHIHERVADLGQKASQSPEKPALFVEKPADNSAPIGREPKPNLNETAGQTFSESAHGKEQPDRPSVKSFPRQLNITEFRTAVSRARNHTKLVSHQSASTHFARAFSSDNTQMSVSELRSVPTQATKAAHTAWPSNISSTMSQQIMESIHGSLQQGERSITIRLHPPELGKVVVRLQEREDQIAGSLELSKAQTRYEIDQALPQIIQTLRDSGVRIERLDVLLTDQSERQADRNHLLQDGSFQQHYSAEGDSSGNKANYERLMDTPDSGYQDDPEPQMQIGDSSINVLI